MRRRRTTSRGSAKTRHDSTTEPKRNNAPTAARPTSSTLADLQEQISALTSELAEAREQQTATSDMLRVISNSPGFIAPCLPIASGRCKSGPEWMHEIKHAGYRLITRRTGDRVRLYTRRGYVWTDRYARIIDALHPLGVRSITVDGEAAGNEDGIL